MAKRVIDDGTLKAIADAIRNRSHTVGNDKLTPVEMPEKIIQVYDDGYTDGHFSGFDSGVEQGKSEASNEKFRLSMSLSEALTSGAEDVTHTLEENIDQAKADIGAIKRFIENYNVEVPVGTPSSTYIYRLDEIIIAEKSGSQSQGYNQGYSDGEIKGLADGIEQGKQSAYDEFLEEKTVTGYQVVEIKNIAEVEQEVKVQLSSDNITDFSNTIVKKGILLNLPLVNSSFNTITGESTYSAIRVRRPNPIQLKQGTYTIEVPNNNCNFVVYVYNIDGSYLADESWVAWNSSNTFTFELLGDRLINFAIRYSDNSNISPNEIDYVWLYNNTETNSYQSNRDGFVEFNTTDTDLMLIANGVNISVTYWYNKALEDGIEQGKKSAYDEFWDEYQQYGAGRPFNMMFASAGWNDKTFKPKYSMKYTSGANSMFYNSRITDLQAILERQGVTIDFSLCGSFANMLYDSTITHIGEVSTVSAGGLTSIFNGATKLVTVDLLKLNTKGSQSFSNSFDNCTSLVNIKIEGVIGNTINFQYSPLSKASIESIITALSTTASGKTLTLKKTAVNEAFGIDVDDTTTYPEGSEYYTLRHSKDNWTISYV